MSNSDALETLLGQARAAFEMQRYAVCLELAQQALGLDARNHSALYLRTQSLLSLHRHQESLSCAVEALSLYPDDATFLFQHAMCLLHLDRYRAALAQIDRSCAIDPDDPAGWALKANIHTYLDEYEQAHDAADTGLNLDPENIVCLHNRAMAYQCQGHERAAHSTYSAILGLDPEHSEALCDKAAAELSQGNVNAALMLYMDGLRLNPGDDNARKGLLNALSLRHPLLQHLFTWFLERRDDYNDLASFLLRLGLLLAAILFLADAPLGIAAATLVLPFIFYLMNFPAQTLAVAALRLSPQTRIYLTPDESAFAIANLLTVFLTATSAVLWMTQGLPLFWLLAMQFGVLSLLLQMGTRSPFDVVRYAAWIVLGGTHALAAYALHAELSVTRWHVLAEEHFPSALLFWACALSLGAAVLYLQYAQLLRYLPRVFSASTARRFLPINILLLILGALPALYWGHERYAESQEVALNQVIFNAECEASLDRKSQRIAYLQSLMPQRSDLPRDSVGFRVAHPFGPDRHDTLLLYVEPSDRTLRVRWNHQAEHSYHLGIAARSLAFSVLCHPAESPDTLRLYTNASDGDTRKRVVLNLTALANAVKQSPSDAVQTLETTILDPLGHDQDFSLDGKEIRREDLIAGTLTQHMPFYTCHARSHKE